MDGEIFIWIIYGVTMGVLSHWLAKKKGVPTRLWTALGVVFGPCVLIILAVMKKSSAPSNGKWLPDQAAEGIRNIRYSVDNAASKIGGTDALNSGNKIANEIRGIFKKR